jgi:hypothetical protein
VQNRSNRIAILSLLESKHAKRDNGTDSYHPVLSIGAYFLANPAIKMGLFNKYVFLINDSSVNPTSQTFLYDRRPQCRGHSLSSFKLLSRRGKRVAKDLTKNCPAEHCRKGKSVCSRMSVWGHQLQHHPYIYTHKPFMSSKYLIN